MQLLTSLTKEMLCGTNEMNLANLPLPTLVCKQPSQVRIKQWPFLLGLGSEWHRVCASRTPLDQEWIFW